jgi:hypothetical protein
MLQRKRHDNARPPQELQATALIEVSACLNHLCIQRGLTADALANLPIPGKVVFPQRRRGPSPRKRVGAPRASVRFFLRKQDRPTEPSSRVSRRFILGAAVICVPAVIRSTSLMPIRGIVMPVALGPSSPADRPHAGFCERLRYYYLDQALKRGWDDIRDARSLNCPSEAQARIAVARARRNGWLSSA